MLIRLLSFVAAWLALLVAPQGVLAQRDVSVVYTEAVEGGGSLTTVESPVKPGTSSPRLASLSMRTNWSPGLSLVNAANDFRASRVYRLETVVETIPKSLRSHPLSRCDPHPVAVLRISSPMTWWS